MVVGIYFKIRRTGGGSLKMRYGVGKKKKGGTEKKLESDRTGTREKKNR